ncbi:MAG: hypothetical protein FWE47_04585 [Oscillospiraceae bacterium]|nr:hypothetical protein [Oscillospiraceae bacterium]
MSRTHERIKSKLKDLSKMIEGHKIANDSILALLQKNAIDPSILSSEVFVGSSRRLNYKIHSAFKKTIKEHKLTCKLEQSYYNSAIYLISIPKKRLYEILGKKELFEKTKDSIENFPIKISDHPKQGLAL